MLLRLQHSEEVNPFSWNIFYICYQRVLQNIEQKYSIWSIPTHAIWSIVVQTFQTTAEINLNSINSLFFSGKSKKVSLKLSHHDHSNLDMVDAVTFLIKTQKISKKGLWSFKHEAATLYQDSGVLQMGNWSQLCSFVLMSNETFTEKEDTF